MLLLSDRQFGELVPPKGTVLELKVVGVQTIVEVLKYTGSIM
ncbi:hypothetical protein [uncultured Clostridium sp.]|nr:hypothetical protein [uncultured Clostridium sp.]